ncbi:uncharacterized protein PODANS_2_9315 [Podospora anserina S mat+]|uniref:Podospora anserina S mat+ genomic DNA chromosome 2, supercontig 2 n=1 Tax=Podospora anserina (strain S / ATCC MYA-4624 / DSM 980 / FGSC 10383) TaxID=515849 RepID=B2B6Y8_PODAN|nr:uncharacterized protein PODANS_2_9315 [Podospora anserina S mat+]CAP73566.1 unnamed protein product [Podospora anserina S mat+]CDP25969.1 Putative protein of unknown function [Podospora anserina S mat+]
MELDDEAFAAMLPVTPLATLNKLAKEAMSDEESMLPLAFEGLEALEDYETDHPPRSSTENPCLIKGTVSEMYRTEIGHIISPLVNLDLGKTKKFLQCLEQAWPLLFDSAIDINSSKDLFRPSGSSEVKEKFIDNESWNQICLGLTVKRLWMHARFGLKYLNPGSKAFDKEGSETQLQLHWINTSYFSLEDSPLL